jgi:hypothetical protein
MDGRKRVEMTVATSEERPLTMSGTELYPALFPELPDRELIHGDPISTLILKKYVPENVTLGTHRGG